MARPDAIVIGAGIVGAAVADALSLEGLRVLVLERGCVGGGTTAAGMGHLVALDGSPEELALSAWSLALWRDLLGGLPATAEYLACGTLWVAEDAEQLAAAKRRATAYRAAGVEVELLDPAALADAEPALRPNLAGALRVPGDGVAYPPALARALLARAGARGAEVRPGTEVRAIGAGAVTTASGVLEAGVIVNAAGPWAPVLTPGLPIVPRKGHLVITERTRGFCRHQVVEAGYLASAHALTGASVAFNVQPRATGQILIGSSRELAGWDAAVSRHTVSAMLGRAGHFMPGLRALTAVRTWTGFRPAPRDHRPLIGAWPGTPGLWIAAGHEGLGITLAPATGRLLADLIVGRQPQLDPAPFAPARFDA